MPFNDGAYHLASTAREKFCDQVSQGAHNLRLLIAHANLLDTLIDELNAEGSEEAPSPIAGQSNVVEVEVEEDYEEDWETDDDEDETSLLSLAENPAHHINNSTPSPDLEDDSGSSSESCSGSDDGADDEDEDDTDIEDELISDLVKVMADAEDFERLSGCEKSSLLHAPPTQARPVTESCRRARNFKRGCAVGER